MPPQQLPLLLQPPGGSFQGYIHQVLYFGKQIRDEWVWDFPLLPGALTTYQQMAAGREWRVSGPPRQVSRAVEWLNEAVCYNTDGIVERGWRQYQARRVMDYLCIGRTLFRFDDELEYLDPTEWHYDIHRNRWYSNITRAELSPDVVVADHPIPLGGGGRFRSVIASIIPTAMLAWLIREHDRAAADGRKLRDILLVLGPSLADQIKEAMELSLKLWSGEDPTKLGIPVVDVESIATNSLSAADHVARIGIANIPEGFDRAGFQFEYVNEIAAATGIALRHFWNSEKATNRALEEVQEARQAMKGPSSYVRNEQSLLRDRKVLARKFGAQTKMHYIEEVDNQSKQANAIALEKYSVALEKFATVFAGSDAKVNGEAFLGWLQRDQILPADIDLIAELSPTLIDPNAEQTPDGSTTRIASNNEPAKSFDLEQDEVVMDMQGRVIERRARVFTIEKAIYQEIIRDEGYVEDFIQREQKIADQSFTKALSEGRERYREKFFSLYPRPELLKSTSAGQDFIESLYENQTSLDDDHYRFISNYMREHGETLW